MSTQAAGALIVRRDRLRERTEIEQRREEVWRLRFGERLSERQIVDRLAKLDPPILVNRSTVSRDIEATRAHFRRVLRRGGFDPRAELGAIRDGIEAIIGKSFRDERRAADGKERALHRKIALDAFAQLSTLYQDTGLMQPRDFELPPDEDGRKAERIPTFDELNAKFASIDIPHDELRSAAEIAWLHGDVVEEDESDR